MESGLNMTVKQGLMGMINQHSWMFLSSYEKLREHITINFGIVNMLHLGPRTFEELSGEVVQSVAFILKNGRSISKATYYRLIDYKGLNEKENNFLKRNNEFKNISQNNFSKIPGSPIAYWVGDKYLNTFKTNNFVNNNLEVKQGLATGNNDVFLRNWYEVSSLKVNNFSSSIEKAHLSEKNGFLTTKEEDLENGMAINTFT